ncbi:MAG: OmpA family protein [Cyclobacteriaceae bacterium]
MKNYIITILTATSCFLCQSLIAQIRFAGEPIDLLELNTAQGENYVVLSPHKKMMAFSKEGSDTGLSDEEYVERFYEAFDSTWNPPRVFTNWEQKEGMFSPIGFDSEGNEYFSEVSFFQGVYTGRVSKFSASGGVAYIDVPFLNSKSAHQSGCLSKDGKYMILSMESNYTYGVEDLYMIERKSSQRWKAPVNLGRQINSKFQEITPFLAADNKTLFFSTNGRDGAGSFDIYYSTRLDDSWRNWSEPVNIGAPVNTSGSETSFSFLGNDEWAYYVSSQDSDGYGDIQKIKIRTDIEEDTTSVEEVAEEVVASNGKISLKVVDIKTGKALWSEMILATERVENEIGFFEIETLNNEEIEIKSQGYLPVNLVLNSDLKIGVNIVELEPVTVGSTITLNHVLFRQSTSKMMDGSEKELDLVVEMMEDNPTIKILLKGHTDSQGDPVQNIRLSEARVKAVKKYLVSKGVNAYRMRSIGYGGNAPIASNDSEETRKLNRRVEFEVVEN